MSMIIEFVKSTKTYLLVVLAERQPGRTITETNEFTLCRHLMGRTFFYSR